MTIKESDVPSAPAARARTKRFRNWKLIGSQTIAVAFGIYAFLAWAPQSRGYAGLLVALLCVWPLSQEVRGLAISARAISFPRGRLARLPILPLRRRLRTSPTGLGELTVTQPWYSFQIVEIQGEFGSELLVFESRNQRLRFMSAVQEICPEVRMFRRGSPSVASEPALGPPDMNRLGDRRPRTRPMKYRVQFLDDVGNLVPDSQADVHDLVGALALIEDAQWPPDAVRLRVLDAKGRVVHQG
jgi:hypothetical protein